MGYERGTDRPIIDEIDVALLRYMQRAYNCRTTGADCPVRADCPEGFYVCDAVANIVAAGQTAELGNTAKRVVRHLYDQIDCTTPGCPAGDRCREGEAEPCRTLLLKLGVSAD